MNYTLPSLTIEQITNLYLYGQPNTPANLIDDGNNKWGQITNGK